MYMKVPRKTQAYIKTSIGECCLELPRAGGPEGRPGPEGGPGPGQDAGQGDLLQEDPAREEQEVMQGSELRLSPTDGGTGMVANGQCILTHFTLNTDTNTEGRLSLLGLLQSGTN